MQTFIDNLEKLSPIITIAISSLVSYFIAKNQAKNEIKKTLLSFNREDKQALNDAFTNLMTKTERLCCFKCSSNIYDATEANVRFLSLAPKEFHPILNDLHTAIDDYNISKIQTIRKNLMKMYSQKN